MLGVSWSPPPFALPFIANLKLGSYKLHDNSSPNTDQPCRLITTLFLLVLCFYDYEQSNAPPSTHWSQIVIWTTIGAILSFGPSLILCYKSYRL